MHAVSRRVNFPVSLLTPTQYTSSKESLRKPQSRKNSLTDWYTIFPRQIRSFSPTKHSFGFFLTEPPTTQKPERGTPYLVTNLVITKFGDKFITKFGEHQIRHQKWWQFCHQFHHQLYHWIWWAPNSVMNFSPNLVNTKFGDKFSDKFVTLFGDHQICHRICHQTTLDSYMDYYAEAALGINCDSLELNSNKKTLQKAGHCAHVGVFWWCKARFAGN